jgi:hypothetical protein
MNVLYTSYWLLDWCEGLNMGCILDIGDCILDIGDCILDIRDCILDRTW